MNVHFPTTPHPDPQESLHQSLLQEESQRCSVSWQQVHWSRPPSALPWCPLCPCSL